MTYGNRAITTDLAAINPAECALLIIDELGDPEAGALKDLLLPPTLNTAKLAEAARAAGVPVIFCNDAHIEGVDRELELWGNHNLAGAPEAQPSPQLNRQPSDYVIEKRRYSAFFQTGLQLLLNELGVKTLICTGFDTNICVQHTVADGYFNNYRIVVVEDATASFLVGDHAEGLAYQQKCYAAAVVSTDEVLKVLKK